MEQNVVVTDPVSSPPRSRQPRAPGLRPWCRLVLATLARVYLILTLSLVAIAVLPALGSWSSYVVRTGSMMPAIKPGDVVLAAPLSPDAPLPMGRVLTFVDPAKTSPSAPDRVLVHRVVADLADGTYTTRGDANRSNDSTPVPRASFVGQGRLLVPFVGRPARWLMTGDLQPFLLFAIVTWGAVFLAVGRQRGRPQRSRRATVRVARRLGPAVAGVAVVALVAQVVAGHAGAAFSGATRNLSNTWSVAARILLGYDVQVLADAPYAYYPLEDAAGPAMTDASGNGRTGTYVAVSAFHQPGAMRVPTGYAVALSGGGGRMISGGTAVVDPRYYSLELWFKTTTAAGGKLIGFESTQQATSPSSDRHVFMRNDGKLTYGAWSGSSRMITTPLAYNNGLWHHLVVSAHPDGTSAVQQATIYVDGVSIVTGTIGSVNAYSGWWRAGYGTLAQGTGYPTSANFTGTIDNVALYSTELTAARVAAHFAAR